MRLPSLGSGLRSGLRSGFGSVVETARTVTGLRAGNRPAWTVADHAHIEIGGPLAAGQATAVERALCTITGVRWAAYNGVLDRIVVSYQPDSTGLADLVRAVDTCLGPYRPGSAGPERDLVLADAVALAGEAFAVVAGLAGRALRVVPVPAELTALPALVDLIPAAGRRLGDRLGPGPVATAGALGAALIAAAAQTPLTPLAGAALRVLRVAEARARREAARRAEAALYRDAAAVRAVAPVRTARPCPLPPGPIERYRSRATSLTLASAAVAAPWSGGPGRAARLVAVGSPRAAGQGREAYASRLGRLLADRGVLVLDPAVLRRLDRVDTIIVDASVLHTGRAERDPLATAVLAAGHRAGRVLIAGPAPGLADRADGMLPGGARLAASVRAEQRRGHGVLLVTSGGTGALAVADCGIGVPRPGRRPPWNAHMITRPGLDDAWLMLEATALAGAVSARSVKIAMLGSVAGALLLITAPPAARGRHAAAPGSAAGLINVIGGAWSAAALRRRGTPLPEDTMPWHSMPGGEVLRTLDTGPDGLSDPEAGRRRTGDDRDTHPPGLLRATVEELDNPLTAPLTAGAAVSTATGGLTDAALVIAVQAANAMLGAGQRLAAGKALRELVTASALRVRLLREGTSRQATADELVPGDIITLRAGDVVPADCRVVDCGMLEVDESSLTGESQPVGKGAEPTPAPAVADRTSMVYAGTTVVAGTATAVVIATGRRTEAGRGADAADRAPSGGVEARLHRLTAASLPVAAGAAALMLGAGLLRGQAGQALRSAVALAVAAVPEGLPFVATVAQLSAARRLSAHNVLVRHPRTMEGLGRLDVVCFDKTGTLTEGAIRLRTVSDGREHAPIDALTGHHRDVLAAALRASPPANGDDLPPHPTDRAVLAGGQDAKVTTTGGGVPGWRLVRELPFEPGRGFHAVLGELPDGKLISVKGAPDTVLRRCVSWRVPDPPGDTDRPHRAGTPGGSNGTGRDEPDRTGAADRPDRAVGPARPLTRADRRRLTAEVDRLAAAGLRVLAVAERPASHRHGLDDDRVERLEFRGLLGLADPVRATSAEAIQRLRQAGITPVMLTGDHPGTAEAIAAELGILDHRGVVKGPELDGLDEQQLLARVTGAAVFARVSPAHKVTIVRTLRQAGRVVAVTGDGANDAPAIRLADVGIALGTPGTAAAREAADLIVTDDRIETIVNAVVEGRAMWSSVRDAVALLLGGNLGEIAFTLASSLISTRPVLNARQLLLVNLVTDLLPAIALAARPPRHVTGEQLLREGPDRSLGSALTRDIAQRAVATTLAATGGWLAGRLTGTQARAGTIALASLVCAQLAQTAGAAHGDPVVLASAGLSALALVAAVQIPGVSGLFGCRPLGPLAWAIVAAATAAGAVVGAVPVPGTPDSSGVGERRAENVGFAA